jgi:hypothetical protein
VLHRDVKPANVMVDGDGKAYLMDFGLAGSVAAEASRMTRLGTVLGTPEYMAPEQAAGDVNAVGPAADQYGAGVVLYELLTGQTPFEGPTEVVLFNVLKMPPPPPSRLRPGLHPGLEALCLRALAKKPEDRFPDCAAFASALRSCLGAPTAVPPVAAVTPPAVRQPADRPTVRPNEAARRTRQAPPAPRTPDQEPGRPPSAFTSSPRGPHRKVAAARPRLAPLLVGAAAAVGGVVVLGVLGFIVLGGSHKTPPRTTEATPANPDVRIASGSELLGTKPATTDPSPVSTSDPKKAEQPPPPAADPNPQTPSPPPMPEPKKEDPPPPPKTVREHRWAEADLTAGKVRLPDLGGAKLLWEIDCSAKPFPLERAGYAYANGRFVIDGRNYWERVGPRSPATDFACEVVFRVVGAPGERGGLVLSRPETPERSRAVQILLGNDGRVSVEPWVYDGDGSKPGQSTRGPGPLRVNHPAVRGGAEVNTLTVIVRGQLIEVYVNGTAVCNPVSVKGDFTQEVILQALGQDTKAKMEFERVRAWSVAGMLTPFQKEE